MKNFGAERTEDRESYEKKIWRRDQTPRMMEGTDNQAKDWQPIESIVPIQTRACIITKFYDSEMPSSLRAARQTVQTTTVLRVHGGTVLE